MSEQLAGLDAFEARGNVGMFCMGCGLFDSAVRFTADGVKTCDGCGRKGWSTAPPVIRTPAVPWALSDFDRIVLIHYGIGGWRQDDGARGAEKSISGTGGGRRLSEA